ncbi:hypothetical protein WA158_006024 [Blastocystis sp. Blastoise]
MPSEEKKTKNINTSNREDKDSSKKSENETKTNDQTPVTSRKLKDRREKKPAITEEDIKKATEKMSEYIPKKREYKSFKVNKKLYSLDKRSKKEAKLTKNAIKETNMLLPEEGGYLEAEGVEKTGNFSQKKLKKEVDISVQKRMFNLELTQFGPYICTYNREGSTMLIAGRKGHLAMINAHTHKLVSEINVKQSIRDITFLCDDMYAVAQKKYLYVYDSKGTELHCLRQFDTPEYMTYLPYHFLLCNTSRGGQIAWQDISTGEVVADYKPKFGISSSICHNPQNAVVHVGFKNGEVSLFSPNQSKFLVRMMCHQGSVTDVKVDLTGKYMVTAGMDQTMKIWDLRTYQCLYKYRTDAIVSSIDISQRGLVACSMHGNVKIWKNLFTTRQKDVYMRELYPEVDRVAFRPFQDQLLIGHSNGVSSMIVPGAGEANVDTMELNIYNNFTRKQRRENFVQKLLDKLPWDSIVLDPNSLF